ncbi:MAG: ComF family protein [Bacteroidales bacterium]|nr:ComF family protein [Bacteroidales bacterium]
MKKIFLLIDRLLSVFYPRVCVACGDLLQQNEPHLCLHCQLHLPETNYHLEAVSPLEVIFRGRVPVQNTLSFLSFRKGNSVQHILHQLKYKGNKEIGAYLGEMYGRKLAASGRLADADMILPIPLHPKKMRLRGYNQSEWIAKGLSAGLGIPYDTSILVRRTFTETQTKKGRFARWQNVKDVFAVAHADRLAGRHVIVCDDVLTTGATTEAAIQKLLEVPDVRVSVVTLATAQ